MCDYYLKQYIFDKQSLIDKEYLNKASRNIINKIGRTTFQRKNINSKITNYFMEKNLNALDKFRKIILKATYNKIEYFHY
jgi:hypothetical protein